MLLSSLLLVGFRNYPDYQVEFSPITVFVGPNGAGKSNLIEAIYLLSTSKSQRAISNKDMVNWQTDFSHLCAYANGKKIELTITKETDFCKHIKINGIKKKKTDLLGVLPSVLFTPESLEIITGSPNLRRRFLNLTLAQTNKDYAHSLIKLSRVIKCRNKILSGIKDGVNGIEELVFWNKELVDLGSFIISQRQKYLSFMQKVLPRYYQEITGQGGGQITVKYLTNVPRLDHFADLLEAKIELELACASSLYGPHRDDLSFIVNGRNIADFGSRGDLRSLIIALKLVELEFLTQHGSQEVLLLLDDVFSELDHAHRKHIFKVIDRQQTIITTTEADYFKERKGIKIVNLEEKIRK